MLSKVSSCIDWGGFYVQNSLKLGRFLTPLLPCRFVTLPEACSSSENQYTNAPVLEISAWKARFNILIHSSTPRQFVFPAEGMLGGRFWTFSMFGSLRILGFLKLVVYGKAWLTTFWRSETMGSGRNCRRIFRLASLWCLIYVLCTQSLRPITFSCFQPTDKLSDLFLSFTSRTT